MLLLSLCASSDSAWPQSGRTGPTDQPRPAAGSNAAPSSLDSRGLQPYTLEVTETGNDRVALEVSFPSAQGTRTIVDEKVNSLLGEIQPSAIPDRTVVVFRDGRVLFGRGAAPPALSALRPSAIQEGSGIEAAPNALSASFVRADAGFTDYGGGIATLSPTWGDYDNDGDPDLPLYRNEGNGRFSEIPGFRALLQGGNYHGGAWCDYDRDGDLDLVIPSYTYPAAPARTLLLRNQGDGSFVNIASAQRMDVAGNGETPVWGDFDADGWPDLFVPYYTYVTPFQCFLYHNDGHGNFTDIAGQAGVSLTGWPQAYKPEGTSVADWDNDGDLDLYCASHLWLNDGTAKFTDVRQQVGLPLAFDEGATFVDYDSDGDLDLWLRLVDSGHLYRNSAGRFTDVTVAAGILPAPLSWGDSWADVDNDGDLDLLYYQHSVGPARLMLNRGDGTFVSDAAFAALNLRGTTSVWADADGDGDLDVVEGDYAKSLFLNQLSTRPGFGSSFLRVLAVNADGRLVEQGATVRLRRRNGAIGPVQTRVIAGGASYLGQNEYTTHFGLGAPGFVARNPDQPSYDPGTLVELTATPAPLHHFVGWSGDAGGAANPLTVPMDGNKRVTATFAIDTYTLDVSAKGGTVTRNPELPAYEHGTTVKLTALPAPGYHFVGWSGDAGGSTNPLIVAMDGNKTITATFSVALRWLGSTVGGDGISWTDGRNWSGGIVPAPSDRVILDNVSVPASYRVELPPGATTVTIERLRITPLAGRTITLILPATNTGTPGLRVGDGTAGPDDVVLDAGGVLRNSSGAAAGNGIEPSSVAYDTVRINGGGRYVHNTLRPPNGLGPCLSTAPGTERGEFEYDVPGRASYGIATACTYGSLILTRSAGSGSYASSGAGALTIRGDLRINSGVTYSSTMTGRMVLAGDLTNNGATLSLPASQPVTFNGSGLQTISGSGSVSLGGSSSIGAGATLVLGATTFTNNGAMTIEGALQIDQGGAPAGRGTYSYNPSGGTLVFNPRNSLNVGTANYWPEVNAPAIVTVQGKGISLNAGKTVAGLFQTSAVVTKANRLTLSGTLRLDPGGSLSNSPTYSGEATLVYGTGFTVSDEWLAGSSVGVGVPKHVTVAAGAGMVRLPGTDRTVPGDLTIQSGSLALDSTGGNLVLLGNFSASGGLASNGRAVVLSGTGTQTVSGGAGLSIDHLRLVKGSGSVQLLSDLTCAAATGGNALDFSGTADVLDLNGHTLTIVGTLGGTDATGALKGSSASSLVLNGSGAAGTVRFLAGSQTLDDLTLNRGERGSVTLGTPLTVGGTLTLAQGSVVTGGNTLTIASGGAVARTSGYVAGSLRKRVPTGPSAVSFEVGSDSTYAPVDVEFGSVTTEGDLTATTTPGDHPGIGSSTLNPARSVNRYWTLTNSGAALDSFSGTFHFAAGDLDPGADPLDLAVRKYDTPAWSVTTAGARTATSVQATGMTSFSDFAIGHVRTYTLDLVAIGEGSVAKQPEQAVYDSGTTVTLTATPAPGHSFVSWGGDASGSTNPATATLSANRNISAQFTYSLSVATVGSGSVAKSPDQTGYAPGSTVTLTATPAAGHHFVGWSGDSSGTANPLAVTMNATKSITATFAINTYTLDLTAVGGGTVARSPDQATYDHGTAVALIASPAPGHSFLGWGGDASGKENPATVIMDGDKRITATFAINVYTLAVTAAGNGTVAKDPDQASYEHGSTVTLTAMPEVGHHFEGWSGDTSGTANPLALTMDANKTVVATFAVNTYTLDVTAVGGGTVARSPDQASYEHGTTVTLTATPAPGDAFVGWSGDTSGKANPLAVVMEGNKSIIATFADTSGPSVRVLSPNGGELLMVGTDAVLLWEASDNMGVASVDLLLSRNGSAGPYEPIALGEANGGVYPWTVSGSTSPDAVLRVVARDAAGNSGADASDSAFAIIGSVAVEQSRETDFALTSVVPNPTPGGVRVTYTVPREARIRLSLMDVQGREIAILVQGMRSPGRFTATWSGQTRRGDAAPGTYFVRYRAAGRDLIRRVVVTR